MNERVVLKVGNSAAPTDPDAQLHVQHVRNLVGAFYESLAAYVFGAEHWEGGPIYADEVLRGRDAEFEDRVSLTPDLVRRHNATWIEVKGGSEHSMVKAFLWQAHLYDRIRQAAQVPIYRPRIQYAFFIHPLERMTRTLKTASRVIEALSRRTQLALLVDLDIVLALRNWCGTRQYGTPQDRMYYPDFYCLMPWRLKALHQHPRCCLDEILGADQANFRVRRRTIGAKHVQLDFMNRVLIQGTPLAPFDLVTIQRKRNSRPAYDGPVDKTWLTHQAKLIDTKPKYPFEPEVPWSTGDSLPF